MSLTHPLTALRRFFLLLKAHRKEVGYIYLYAILAGLLNLVLPLGIQAIISLINGGTISSSWWLLIGVVTLGTMLSGLLVVLQMAVSETLQRSVFVFISFDFAKRLPMLKTEPLRREYIPEMVNRFFDTLTIQKGVPKMLIELSTTAMQILFGLILLALYHPLFIMFGLILLMLLMIIFYVTYPPGLRTSLVESKYKYEVAYWLQELGRTMTTFKMRGSSELPLKRTDFLVSHYLSAKKNHFRVLVTQYYSVIGFKVLITFLLLSLGGWLVINNQLNVGQFVAAEILIILILNATEKLISTLEITFDVLTALEKIATVTEWPIDQPGGLPYVVQPGSVGMSLQIRGLSFKFLDAQRPVLDNLYLNIAPGERVCVTGYNGSGKTTLVQLVAGLLDNYTGQISYDGVPRVNYDQVSLRRAIGDFSAHDEIFRGTVLENITMGYDGVPIQEVVDVCQKLQLIDFIRQLPQGFDTLLLPEGRTLPRSVITKLKLARCIISKPALIAIEEVMHNLESSDVELIAQILTDRSYPWSLLAVTTTTEFARRCDRVIVLKQGRVVMQGTFEEVMASEHGPFVFNP